ncbi:MAG TPA: hypothetical protein VGL71_01405 [Urbifossiella sp.]|jgi:hypothetical protein
MNCQSLQNRILALPDPRQVPETLREHLSACPACSAWWKQAIRLERLLAQLPAPAAPSDKKAALIDELTAAGPVIRSIPAIPRPSGRSIFVRAWSQPAVRTIAGLAAAILIVVSGWMMTRPGPGPEGIVKEKPRDPFLEKIVQRDLALAQAKSSEQRLEVLGTLADDLSAEARSLSKIANPDELRDLSGMFQKVVNDGIVEQVRRIPEHALTQTQKRELLQKLSAKLDDAGQQAERAALESPTHSQPALKTISTTARDGQEKLKAILGARS